MTKNKTEWVAGIQTLFVCQFTTYFGLDRPPKVDPLGRHTNGNGLYTNYRTSIIFLLVRIGGIRRYAKYTLDFKLILYIKLGLENRDYGCGDPLR
jgi:hypothetical protein